MTKLFTRRWFKIGLVFVAVGLFCYFLSIYETGKYEAQYPELGRADHELFLDRVNNSDPSFNRQEFKTKAEQEAYHSAVMLHGLYGMYRYVGWIFAGIGILFMLLSIKEPQVPSIDDLDDSV